MGRGSEDLEIGIDFEARNKDMEILRLKKKIKKLQKALRLTAVMVEGKSAIGWLKKNIDSLMEKET